MGLLLKIITPEKEHFSEDVDLVTLPGQDGMFTVLPNHAPIVSIISPGELYYKSKDDECYLAVGEGFVEVSNNQVNVATDIAVGDEDIDESAVEDALERAREALKGEVSPTEVSAIKATISKSLAQLKLKHRRSSLMHHTNKDH